ncbi:hypothetical protein EDF56_101827 [Novosphingobium sp. PhB165]|uniref:hypothetical protein n=1 Tax=Novosphingobium sp. PhB165 TaxID=2485105 RepID=UPI001050346C|nr:hypothetical protein [Novosphingobium sp. PhB165]TCM22145.1 hypothetical protein EDF56_101827 [Novosphingobium sp. PhB165]
MARKFLISRIALAVALSGGMAVAMVPAAASAKDAKKADAAKYSDAFIKAAGPIEKAVNAATAALPQGAGPDAFPAAKSSIDTALGGNGKAAMEAAIPSATTPDDKLALGQLIRTYGVLAQDLAFKQSGVQMMIASGKIPATSAGSTYFDAGVNAFNLKDYANAATYLKQAKDAGYQDPQGQLDMILAESYKRGNNPEAAMAMAKADIDAARAKGVAPSESSLRSVLQQAYNAKQLDASAEYAGLLVQYYPRDETWNISTSIVRQLGSFDKSDNLDLMRLMFISGGMKDKRDYFEYLEDADPRAYPGEALKVMDQGLAKGLLTQAEVGADRANSASRVPADKASLPATERDALKPGATAAQVMTAADVFLSYSQYDKAEELFKAALAKPGVDANKANLRLGMAQAMQGKNAEAQATLAKVTDKRSSIAKLWSAYAAGKGARPAA